MLTALRGALGFLSRLPVGGGESAWEAFRARPAAFPLAGYLLGAVAALPIAAGAALALPGAAVAVAYPLWLFATAGITHLDGIADLGDALVIHGDADDRRQVMGDSAVGVGGVLAIVLVVAGLAGGAAAVAALGLQAVALVIVAEVAAKVATAAVACLGSASHEGLGSALTGPTRPASLAPPVLLALPATLLTWPRPAGSVALAAGATAGLLPLWWGRRNLGGVSGDLMGTANELGRLVALHAGVIAWTRL